jgi:hypothetical protein
VLQSAVENRHSLFSPIVEPFEKCRLKLFPALFATDRRQKNDGEKNNQFDDRHRHCVVWIAFRVAKMLG